MRIAQIVVVIRVAMRVILLLSLSIFAFPSFAETNLDTAPVTTIPSKGMTQEQVKTTFGEPSSTKPPVGKPAIIRWDYPDYSVYFEGKYVIHSFQHSKRTQARAPALKPKPLTVKTQETTLEENTQVSEDAEIDAAVAKAKAIEEGAIENNPSVETTTEIVEEPIVEEVAPAETIPLTETPEPTEEQEAKIEPETTESEMEQTVEIEEESMADKVAQEEKATEEKEKLEKPKEEKDLNFEEPETKADIGKWGY